MGDVVATREFSMAGQESFACLSGDANPMHVDRVAARRTEPGEPIVHAVHAILWALEVLSERRIIENAPSSIDARFTRFIYPETTVSVDGQVAFSAAVRFTPQAPRAKPLSDGAPIQIPSTPIALDTKDMLGRRGLLPSMVDRRIVEEFPNAARVLGAERVKGLAALSALVGMI